MAWQMMYVARTHAAMSAPYADPDADGQVNVVEYVLGSSPASGSSAGSLETGVVTEGGQSYLTVSWRLRPDVTTVPEVSSALESWAPAALVEVGRDNRDTVAAAASRFIAEMALDQATVKEDPREKLRALREEFARRAEQNKAAAKAAL
jgi:hypothetical protein